MSKRVRIAIEVDSHFVRMLRATVSLKRLGNDVEEYRQHTALDCLGVVVLAEMMGAFPEQVHAQTPIEWRPHIEAVSELRHVTELPKAAQPAPRPARKGRGAKRGK